MNKFIVRVTAGQKYTAGSKAKEDIVTFLQQEEYKVINVNVPENKVLRILMGNSIWKQGVSGVSEGDMIIYQYPAYSRHLGDCFINNTQKISKLKKVILIHDLDSLRIYHDSLKDIKRELSFLDSFDAIIAHNDKMKEWLLEKGIKTPIVSLEIFDYYETIPTKSSTKDDPIVFAGNLGKSKFLEKMDIMTTVDLFGIEPADKYPENLKYRGAFPSDELGEHLQGSFGLVWDGNSIDECNGMTGEYMRYNNPHKTSLYLTMGIPVIIWKKAALSSFIVDNNVGIAVDSLNELDNLLENLSDQEYQVLKSNAMNLATKLRRGNYIQNAVKKCIDLM
ncbi:MULTISPECIES: sugar transferase [Enterococcus]|uniref:sugar transferase n=1 Tax=Enterococcus TaxID=1350 RepID=UPI000F4DBFAE|nr:sugar transferase [Enterococcus faecium]ROY76022.1 hypothetical protein EGW73_04335 [Enterococcus faecium]ROZ09630.1 hypothetical protein EGW81_04325 [Enterococcus faecium]ROZ21146.1 hypothetical protein EGX09_04325 [Enterococcus faecium]